MIFSLHLGVGHSVLFQLEGLGHVFSNHHISKCSGPPPHLYFLTSPLLYQCDNMGIGLPPVHDTALTRKIRKPICSLNKGMAITNGVDGDGVKLLSVNKCYGISFVWTYEPDVGTIDGHDHPGKCATS